MRFTLRPAEGSATFQKITRGRRWVGRVGRCEDGRYFGKIGETFVHARTAREAFDLVCARQFGFDTAADLQRHNSEVRRRNRERRAAFRSAFGPRRRVRAARPFYDDESLKTWVD